MKRGKFSLSHYRLFTADQGALVPCGITEVLPGDTMQQASHALIRLSPLLAPMMHPVEVTIHHWYVPHRLVWDDFEDFITGGPDGEDDSEFPTIAFDPFAGPVGTLPDYMGVPPSDTQNRVVSALPFRAYALIYNEWYRDQDLVTPLVIDTSSGVDTTTNVTLVNRAWEKDYFTSARPWPQKGPDITIPLGTTAPILYDNAGSQATVRNPTTGAALTGVAGNLGLDAAGKFLTAAGSTAATLDNAANLVADLSGASAASINSLREAFALQRYAEARAQYGSRYTEYLRYLGVRSSDARLQRPEYLGGGKQTLQISEVLQTAPTTDGDDLEGVGNLKGHGIGAMRSNRYRRFFEEHGYVISLISIKPRTMYMNGQARHLNRRTKEDFYQKELVHIGQQEILNKEIYANLPAGTSTVQRDGTFGYQDRYDEYRRTESGVAGLFRTTLNFWHMARDFSSQPTLNAAFVTSTPTVRVYAEQTQDPLWCMVNHSIQARRLLPSVGKNFIY